MTGIRVKTTLTPRDVMRVSAVLVFRNRMSVMLLAVGPLWFVLGLWSGHETVMRLGATLLWIVPIVPALALLAGSYSAYRPGGRATYESAEWVFGAEGVEIAQPGRDARAEWGDFTRWRSAGACLLLHTTKRRYVIIPWRDVPDDERGGLEELLGEKIGGRRR